MYDDGEGGSGPGRNGRRPGEAKNPGYEERIPPAGGGPLLSGGHPEAASVPLDGVHQVRST